MREKFARLAEKLRAFLKEYFPEPWGSILLAMAALVLLLLLCYCASEQAATPAPTPTPTPISIHTPAPTPTPTPSPTPTPAEEEEKPPVYDTVREGCLTVVTCPDFPPYSYPGRNGPVGIDPALAAALAGRLGLSLEIYETDYDALGEEVAQRRADLALAGLVPGKADEGLAYTVGYHVNRQLILAPGGRADALGAEGLAGHTVGVLAGSHAELRLCWDLEDKGEAVLTRFDTGSDALAALAVGEIDCLVLNAAPARALAETNGKVKILPRSYLSERYAGLMRGDNTELYKAVNDAIRALVQSGEAEEIAARYFPGG